MVVDPLTFVTVDTGFHPVGVSGRGFVLFYNEGDLPAVAITGVIFFKKGSDPFSNTASLGKIKIDRNARQ